MWCGCLREIMYGLDCMGIVTEAGKMLDGKQNYIMNRKTIIWLTQSYIFILNVIIVMCLRKEL